MPKARRRPETSENLFARIYRVVRQVPRGRAVSYGQVARMIGPPCSARTVGWALASLRSHHVTPPVPWQRVINARGTVSTGLFQQKLLEEEGVVFDPKGRTSFKQFGWSGTARKSRAKRH
jgi:methylated-DNA-protein-cysteine methyltransferase-like protein